MQYFIEVTTQPINIEKISTIFTDNTGAIVSFIGVIRKTNKNKEVKNIYYSLLTNLFINTFQKKCKVLLENDHKSKIYIIQFSGLLNIKSINSIITVSAEHRKKAFYICRELVETLKYNVPIWKKEIYCDGSYEWINA